jgi:maltose O-acetyltransferase
MGEQADRLRSGDWYLDDDELRELRKRCWRLLDRFNATRADEDAERDHVLAELLGSYGAGAEVMPRFQCSYGTNISLGPHCFVNSNAFLMDDAPIVIGAAARLGPSAQLMTALHPIDDHEKRRAGWERAVGISIGDNAWLGASVTVGPGVTIGRNSVIGAGSTVLRDVPDHVVAAGSPAVVIRTTTPEGSRKAH